MIAAAAGHPVAQTPGGRTVGPTLLSGQGWTAMVRGPGADAGDHLRATAAQVQRGRRAGFTLTELLCVVLIIAVTASLIVSCLVRARHRADAAACASNLRQVGLALRIYAAAHAGHLPPQDNDWAPLTGGPYLPDERVLGCPAMAYDPGAARRGTPLGPLHPGPRYLYAGGYCDDDDPTLEVARDAVTGVHLGTTNALFLDGHVVALRGGEGTRP